MAAEVTRNSIAAILPSFGSRLLSFLLSLLALFSLFSHKNSYSVLTNPLNAVVTIILLTWQETPIVPTPLASSCKMLVPGPRHIAIHPTRDLGGA